MITSRRLQSTDAVEVAALIAKTLRITNAKDYSQAYLDQVIHEQDAAYVIQKAEMTHFYVFCDQDKIVGTGSIGSYWGSQTESSLFDIFVLPTYQGRGIGRQIIQTLEADDYFKRATRIEIPASITALPFYQKMGYRLKGGQTKPDAEQLYRLEKVHLPEN